MTLWIKFLGTCKRLGTLRYIHVDLSFKIIYSYHNRSHHASSLESVPRWAFFILGGTGFSAVNYCRSASGPGTHWSVTYTFIMLINPIVAVILGILTLEV